MLDGAEAVKAPEELRLIPLQQPVTSRGQCLRIVSGIMRQCSGIMTSGKGGIPMS